MKTTTPLPTETAAIWGAFLYEGFMMAEHKLGDEGNLLQYWHSGYLELVIEASKILVTVWEQASQHKDFLNDHPGVFEYEVISELGLYIGDYLVRHEGIMPPKKDLVAAIKYLILSFFDKGRLPVYCPKVDE